VRFYFADTVFWIACFIYRAQRMRCALSRKRDELHERAVAWQRFIAGRGCTIVTTQAVLWEWLNVMLEDLAG
jgi:hypothetical protein